MSWDQRQRAMLAEMGFRLPEQAEAHEAPDVAGAVVVEAPALVAVERAPAAAPVPAPMAARPPTPTPRAAAVVPTALAGLDLAALREAVLDGRACGACEHRVHLFGRGAQPQATWLVVTDPPDEADEGAGELLGGDAGRLLDRMLAAVGQRVSGDGATAFVAPIVPGRAPRGRPPLPQELEAGEAQLARLVELLQPRLVLAMGLHAARRLSGSADPLGRLRGRVHLWRDLPVVVTYHPGYLLRNPADKAGAWDDLCLARKTFNT
ncbi:uracil-DNA glycosylase [Roseateles asaccharophilus]|uniref:DNA polymerase n=1 Tax=Roseateles asaccharophilus TaxID=582607 RepID=A0ABU2AEE0_9BURK|nr:uracil-DNA glycosylase [Roseateles asaccharophilus]MDR7335571.1 DNA polymerase [Roseateles asaccharophilus]